MSEPGGTLHDAIARALDVAFHLPATDLADRVLVAFKEYLAEHPEAIQELGWVRPMLLHVGTDGVGWRRIETWREVYAPAASETE